MFEMNIEKVMRFDSPQWPGNGTTRFNTYTTIWFECGCVMTTDSRTGDGADDVLNEMCKMHYKEYIG